MLMFVKERLMLLNVLPREGNFVTIKIIRNLREELSFSEEEAKAIKLRQDGSKVVWDTALDKGKEIVIGEIAEDTIKKTLRKLNDSNSLTADHITLYQLFIKE